jgi:hypothetical protein
MGDSMIKIIFKIEGREVGFNDIPNGPTKKILHDFKTAVEAQVESVECKRHHRGPVITMYADDKQFEGFGIGLGTCCDEFGKALRTLITLPVKLPSSDSSTLHIATQTVIFGDYE